MATSKLGFEKNYIINNYRNKRFADKYLVTTDSGNWCFLNQEDFDLLRQENILAKQSLFDLLEKKDVVLTEKNKNAVIERSRKKYAFLWQGTTLHIIIPTLRCNQRCIYCHASSKPFSAKGYDMDKKTAKAVVDFIFQSPSYYISIEFQGGEPLLNFDIVKYVIEYAQRLNKKYQKNLLINLVTNFCLMDKKKLDYLIKKEVGICTSLDGPAFLHNKNRNSLNKIGSHSYVNKWTKELIKEYKKRKIENRRVGALVIITKYSLPYWKEIVDEYVKCGLTNIFIRFLNNLGDARPIWDNISYSAEEFIDFWKKSIDYILELNKKDVYIREWFVWLMLRKLIDKEEPNHFEQRSPCGAAIGQLAYNYNGDIYSCDEGRMIGEDIFKLGNVKTDGYKKILTSNQTCALVAASINDTQICDCCVYKPFCGLCPVCNYAEQGSIIGKITETTRCKIYKAQFDYIFGKLLSDKRSKEIFLDWLARDKKMLFSKSGEDGK